MSKGRARHGGFSLLELLIAFSIIATALLLIIGVFTTILRGSQKTVDLTAGTILAESILDERIYYILNTAPAVDKDNFLNGLASPLLGSGSYMNDTVFSYAIYTTPVTFPGMGLGNRLVKADIIVWWWKPSGSATESAKATQGYGYLRSELSRLVNERSKY
ncbi:MAG: type II secretion system protein [Candidatus Eremiobacterota bacterium]